MSRKSLDPVDSDRRRFLQFSAGGVAITMMTLALGPNAEAAAADSKGPLDVSQKIVTGKVTGKKDWPKYIPANLVLPAHRLIQVTVRCYDDGAADIPKGYNIVRGTVGREMRVIKGTPATIAPNAGTVVREIPVKQVAHTFTVNGEDFFMNIPMPVLSTVVYRFMSPKPGTYPWQCMAACATGSGGWAGAMATSGWMQGDITVQ